MARETSGTHNEPQYSASGAPADAADLSEVATYAVLVGNRKVGTATARGLASGIDVWEGLMWGDTTDGLEYRYTSGAWVKSYAPEMIADIVTFGTGYVATDANAHKPRVRRINNNQVFLYGAVTTTSGFAYTNVVTIPAGFTPPTSSARFIGTGMAYTGSGYLCTFLLMLSGGVVSIVNQSASIGATGTVISIVGSWWMD
jgi:hypothetical protein